MRMLPIIGGVRRYELIEELVHRDGLVPAGFITDGASVPRAFWSIFPHDGGSFPAAIIHDWDYMHSLGTRKQADKRFLSNMKRCGLGWLHRLIIYRAVRVGAGLTWRRYRSRHDESKSNSSTGGAPHGRLRGCSGHSELPGRGRLRHLLSPRRIGGHHRSNREMSANRWKQESTWRGIITVLTACGVMLSHEQQEAIIAAGLAVVGLINILKAD